MASIDSTEYSHASERTVLFHILIVLALTLVFAATIGLIHSTLDIDTAAAGSRAGAGLTVIQTSQPSEDEIIPGKLDYVGFKITNTGDGADQFRVTLEQYPPQWDVYLEGLQNGEYTPNLDQDEHYDATVMMTPDIDAREGTYIIKVKVQSMSDTNVREFLTLRLRVKFIPDVTVVAPSGMSGDPGHGVLYYFEVENNGNGEDRFILQAQTTNQGWGASIIGRLTTDVLDPEESVTVTVQHKVPKGVLVNQTDSLVFNATSLTDRSESDVDYVYTSVNQVFDISLEAGNRAAQLYPGEEHEFSINVSNDGNGFDYYVNLKVAEEPDGPWNPDLRPKGSWDGIGGLSSERMLLKLRVPDHAMRRDYEFVVKAYSDRTREVYQDKISFVVKVLQKYDVGLAPIDRITEVYPPNTAAFRFWINNTGNGEDSFILNYSTADGDMDWAQLSSTSVDMTYSEAQKVTIAVAVPESALAREYTFNITAQSLARPSATSTISTVTHVKPIFRLDIDIEEVNATKERNAHELSQDKREVTFPIALHNAGNARDTYKIGWRSRFDTTDGWKINIENYKSVEPHSTYFLPFSVTVPRGQPLGEYEFEVSATSQTDTNLKGTVTTLVKVIRYDFAISSNVAFDNASWSRYECQQEDWVHISVTFENRGNERIPNEEVSEVDYRILIGSTIVKNDTISDLPPFTERTITFKWRGETKGNHQLMIQIDPEDKIAEFDEENNKIAKRGLIVTETAAQTNTDDSNTQLLSVLLYIVLAITAAMAVFLFVKDLTKPAPEGLVDGEYRPWGKRVEDDDAPEKFIEDVEGTRTDIDYRAVKRAPDNPPQGRADHPYRYGEQAYDVDSHHYAPAPQYRSEGHGYGSDESAPPRAQQQKQQKQQQQRSRRQPTPQETGATYDSGAITTDQYSSKHYDERYQSGPDSTSGPNKTVYGQGRPTGAYAASTGQQQQTVYRSPPSRSQQSPPQPLPGGQPPQSRPPSLPPSSQSSFAQPQRAPNQHAQPPPAVKKALDEVRRSYRPGPQQQSLQQLLSQIKNGSASNQNISEVMRVIQSTGGEQQAPPSGPADRSDDHGAAPTQQQQNGSAPASLQSVLKNIKRDVDSTTQQESDRVRTTRPLDRE